MYWLMITGGCLQKGGAAASWSSVAPRPRARGAFLAGLGGSIGAVPPATARRNVPLHRRVTSPLHHATHPTLCRLLPASARAALRPHPHPRPRLALRQQQRRRRASQPAAGAAWMRLTLARTCAARAYVAAWHARVRGTGRQPGPQPCTWCAPPARAPDAAAQQQQLQPEKIPPPCLQPASPVPTTDPPSCCHRAAPRRRRLCLPASRHCRHSVFFPPPPPPPPGVPQHAPSCTVHCPPCQPPATALTLAHCSPMCPRGTQRLDTPPPPQRTPRLPCACPPSLLCPLARSVASPPSPITLTRAEHLILNDAASVIVPR